MSGMVFCRDCGAEIHSTAPTCPRCGAPQQTDDRPRRNYSFGGSVALCFNRPLQFSGRSPRAEFWHFTLFYILLGLGAAALDAILFGESSVISTVVSLVLLFPSISVFVRRLHDLDSSGWWFWLCLLPVVGTIILLIWAVSRGTPGPNRFGPNPLTE